MILPLQTWVAHEVLLAWRKWLSEWLAAWWTFEHDQNLWKTWRVRGGLKSVGNRVKMSGRGQWTERVGKVSLTFAAHPYHPYIPPTGPNPWIGCVTFEIYNIRVRTTSLWESVRTMAATNTGSHATCLPPTTIVDINDALQRMLQAF